MMRIDIATLFVDMCESVLNESIIGRARQNGYIELCCHNIRDYTKDKHRRVDDTPYGGGKGMVMQADPIYKCYESICSSISGKKPYVIYMSPQGNVLTEKKCIELSRMENLLLICGHYEGVDERLIEEIVDEEISIGDYVLTGGELPALVLCDSVARLCDGVLSSDECYQEESHFNGLLEYPQYTRPEIWHDKAVPNVLLSGHHKNIERWRQKQRLSRTRSKRADMLDEYISSQEKLSKLDYSLLQEIDAEEKRLYFDVSQPAHLSSVEGDSARVAAAGTVVSAISEHDYQHDDTYRIIAENHDIHFIVESNIPNIEFYSVPALNIFAYDSKGGLYASVGGTADISDTKHSICYIKNKEVYPIAHSFKEFILPIESITKRLKKHRTKSDDIKLFSSKEDAMKMFNFISQPKHEA